MSERLISNWNYPTNIRLGAGRVSELADACRILDMRAPLLITDPGLAALPMVSAALECCRSSGLDCGLFSDMQANPTGENVLAGVAVFRDGGHDGVIAFGGGSALDTGKAVALMSGQQRPLWDFEDVGDNWLRADPGGIAGVVAVPTTAGTGSEVGRASVIIDSDRQVKKIIFHPGMLPGQVILDPELTLGLPAHITAATGMDALAHCLEAYCAPTYHPMAEGIAIEGMRLVKNFLPAAVASGDNLEARTQMLVASTMGATAFQKGLGAMHAIAHTLGALYGAHHGLLNAILMPYVIQSNRVAIEHRMSRLARYLDLEDPGFDGVMAWILNLRAETGIPHALSAIDIGDSRSKRVGELSLADPAAAGNPIEFTAADYGALFARAVAGSL